jgi:hypothetical protein
VVTRKGGSKYQRGGIAFTSAQPGVDLFEALAAVLVFDKRYEMIVDP